MALCGQNVVIVGGGIMGCSTAYHLTQLGVKCTIVERYMVAGCASGKAGGFLARTWNDSSQVGPLARASYKLHEKYGAQFDVDFRPVETLSVTLEAPNSRKKTIEGAPSWLDRGPMSSIDKMASPQDSAQVHPGKLSKAFSDAACKLGSQVLIDTVVGLKLSPDSKTVHEVILTNGKVLHCDSVVIAMGPWSYKACDWLKGLPRIDSHRGHSVLMKPSGDVPAQALFLSLKDHPMADPEIYPRPDGQVYMCWAGKDKQIPEDPADVTVDEETIEFIYDVAGRVSSSLKEGSRLKGQACYLPTSPKTNPLIGKIKGTNNAFVAAGHSCWGILNGPATGAALAELMVKGKSEIVDLSPFAP